MSPEIERGPMGPSEIEALKEEQIPDEVFDVFNGLIAQNMSGSGCSTVLQKDVIAQLTDRGFNASDIYKNRWLDVEDSYRKQGWKVEYDKPAYYAGEDYEPFFKFKA